MKPLALAGLRAFRLQLAPRPRPAGRCLRAGASYRRRLVGTGERAAFLGRYAHGAKLTVRSAKPPVAAASTASPAAPPLFVAAEPIRR